MDTQENIVTTKKNDLPACPVETTLTLISNKWKQEAWFPAKSMQKFPLAWNIHSQILDSA